MAYCARTDLAIEAAAMLGRRPDEKIEGVEVENYEKNGINVTKVKIKDKNGEKSIGKPMGTYVTLECENIRTGDDDALTFAEKILTKELKKLANPLDDSVILAVGLGNRFVTPDALGPNVIDGLCVTRHLFSEMPDSVPEELRSVCAIAPGVLGITGIETGEIIRGVCEKVKPDLIIAIDALASRSMSRISTTIQLADTGITPGSGVGNKRRGINEETLGVPVIAIGVPTVVDAATVADDTIELMLNEIEDKLPGSSMSEGFQFLKNENRYSLIKKILYPYVGNLIVTPKEVDSVIKDISEVISRSINCALVSKNGNNPELF